VAQIQRPEGEVKDSEQSEGDAEGI